jgi:hypothetical protein
VVGSNERSQRRHPVHNPPSKSSPVTRISDPQVAGLLHALVARPRQATYNARCTRDRERARSPDRERASLSRDRALELYRALHVHAHPDNRARVCGRAIYYSRACPPDRDRERARSSGPARAHGGAHVQAPASLTPSSDRFLRAGPRRYDARFSKGLHCKKLWIFFAEPYLRKCADCGL